MPKLTEPDKCLHHILHPNRLDGAVTVCLMCRAVVSVSRIQYANGKTPDEQYNIVMGRLNQDKLAVPRS